MKVYRCHTNAKSFSPALHGRLWNPNARPAFFAERLQFEGDGAMRNFSPGIWTCAALYAAIGLIGIFLLASGPGVATSSEGYGIAAVAAPASLR